MVDEVEKDAGHSGEREYNAPDVIRSLRGVVEKTEDRDELRVIDSQLRRLLAQIKNKMGGRGRVRPR